MKTSFNPFPEFLLCFDSETGAQLGISKSWTEYFFIQTVRKVFGDSEILRARTVVSGKVECV